MVAVITYGHPITSPTRMSVFKLSVAQVYAISILYINLLLITQEHSIAANRPTGFLNEVESIEILPGA